MLKRNGLDPENESTQKALFDKVIQQQSRKRKLTTAALKLILSKSGKLYFKELQTLLGLNKADYAEQNIHE